MDTLVVGDLEHVMCCGGRVASLGRLGDEDIGDEHTIRHRKERIGMCIVYPVAITSIPSMLPNRLRLPL
jgi:hypothetical protein